MTDVWHDVLSQLVVAGLVAVTAWLLRSVHRWRAKVKLILPAFQALYARDRAIVDLQRKMLYELQRLDDGIRWDMLKDEADDLRDDLWRVENDSRPTRNGRVRREWPGLEELRELCKGG
jgi:uncharacterized protein YoxC